METFVFKHVFYREVEIRISAYTLSHAMELLTVIAVNIDNYVLQNNIEEQNNIVPLLPTSKEIEDTSTIYSNLITNIKEDNQSIANAYRIGAHYVISAINKK